MSHELIFPFAELPVGDFTVRGAAAIEFSTGSYRKIAKVVVDAVYDTDGSDATKFVPIENDDKDVIASLFRNRWHLIENEVRAAITRLAQNV